MLADDMPNSPGIMDHLYTCEAHTAMVSWNSLSSQHAREFASVARTGMSEYLSNSLQ